ncbi:hypothetical protein PsAD2_03034 [Pseudovibrio axinellae]|uniref:DUF4376 domain-containing protein n=1 Tax=Pseudovibrio axinellae TaxID=989403 RepID=A0A165XH56_9HYPH|nr:hypothetical protein [Pseudovibrio axinellae]KZL17697.1 hypothetical protein PsAD2_03034 [Pseudovibrio axinellae]SER43216.1 hypothetical protein SAMN05421798_11047 [Pseudovibrio axinellae]
MVMDKGFYHSERGYWQVNDYHAPVVPEDYQLPDSVDEDGNTVPGGWVTPDRPHHFTDDYPEGTVEVPLKPNANCEWDAGAETWVDVPVTFERLQVAYQAEALIEIGAQINGTQFKTNEQSLQRLRELMDVFDMGLVEAEGRTYSTEAGDTLTFTTREQVEAVYSAAILYRSFVLERSAQIQQLDPIPDPSQDELWDQSQTLPDILNSEAVAS